MKICICSNLFNTGMGGGSEVAAEQLVKGLKILGHEPFVITSRPVSRIINEWVDTLPIYYVPINNFYWVAQKETKPYLFRTLWQIRDIWNLSLYYDYLRILSKERPSILHTNKIRGLSVSMWSAAQKLNIPIIHTSHDYEILSPVGHLVGKIGQLAVSGSWPISFYQNVRRKFSTSVDVFTAPSQYTLEYHRERHFFTKSTTKVVPNSHGFSRHELSEISHQRQNTGEIHFLFLGRLDAIKGIDLLLDTFTDCAKEYSNIYLDIVGEGGDLEQKMLSLYSNHPRIHFHGQAVGERKWKYLGDMSVLVMPVTRRPAVFGLVVVEAYAVGKPVIASAIGGVPEVVDDQETGLLIPPENPEALKNAIMTFARNPELVDQFSDKCFRKAEEYSLENTAEQFEKLYNNLS